MHGGATPHTAIITNILLYQEDSNAMDWPSWSLNPIEHLWDKNYTKLFANKLPRGIVSRDMLEMAFSFSRFRRNQRLLYQKYSPIHIKFKRNNTVHVYAKYYKKQSNTRYVICTRTQWPLVWPVLCYRVKHCGKTCLDDLLIRSNGAGKICDHFSVHEVF